MEQEGVQQQGRVASSLPGDLGPEEQATMDSSGPPTARQSVPRRPRLRPYWTEGPPPPDRYIYDTAPRSNWARHMPPIHYYDYWGPRYPRHYKPPPYGAPPYTYASEGPPPPPWIDDEEMMRMETTRSSEEGGRHSEQPKSRVDERSAVDIDEDGTSEELPVRKETPSRRVRRPPYPLSRPTSRMTPYHVPIPPQWDYYPYDWEEPSPWESEPPPYWSRHPWATQGYLRSRDYGPRPRPDEGGHERDFRASPQRTESSSTFSQKVEGLEDEVATSQGVTPQRVDGLTSNQIPNAVLHSNANTPQAKHEITILGSKRGHWSERPMGGSSESQPSENVGLKQIDWEDRPVGKGAGPQPNEFPDTQPAPRASGWEERPVGKGAGPQPSEFPDSKPAPRASNWEERPVGKGAGPQPSEFPDTKPAPRVSNWEERPVGKGAGPQPSEFPDPKSRASDWEERPVGKGAGPQPSEFPDTKPRASNWEDRPVGKGAGPQPSEFSDPKPRASNWEDRPVGKGAGPQPSELPGSGPALGTSKWDDRPVGKGAGPQPSEFPDSTPAPRVGKGGSRPVRGDAGLQPSDLPDNKSAAWPSAGNVTSIGKSGGRQSYEVVDTKAFELSNREARPTSNPTPTPQSSAPRPVRPSIVDERPLGKSPIPLPPEYPEPRQPRVSVGDERQVGQGDGAGPPEFVEDTSAELDSIPLQDRLTSSKWDENIHGLKEINAKAATLLDGHDFAEPPTGPVVDEMLSHKSRVIALISHKNVSVQKEALDCVGWLFKLQSGESIKADWALIETDVLTGYLSNPRQQAAAIDLVLTFTEVSSDASVIERIVEMLRGYKDAKGNVTLKGPAAKTATFLWTLLTRLVEEFGLTAARPQPAMELVKSFVAVTDRNTREAVYKFCLELFNWSKSKDFATCSMDDKQSKELHKRCDAVNENPKPAAKRSFRNKKVSKNAPAKKPGSEPAAVPKAENDDENLYDILPGVDIFENVNLEKFEKSLKDASKWNEKKALLSNFIAPLEKANKLKVTKQTPFQVKQFYAILNSLIQFEKNAAVIAQAIKCSGVIALCWRQGLNAEVARAFVHAIMPKAKDKNKAIHQSVVETMSSFLWALPLEAFLDDIALVCKDKNPQLRQTLLAWMSHAFSHPATKQVDVVRAGPKLANLATEMIDDTQAPVRAAAAVLLLALQSVAPKLVNSVVEALPPRKKQTAKEALKKAQKESSQEIEACSPTKKHLVASPALSVPVEKFASKSANAADTSTTSSVAVPVPRHTTTESTMPSPKAPEFTEEDIANLQELTATIEECESGIAQILGQEVEDSEILSNCRSTNWANRSAGLDLLRVEIAEASHETSALMNRTDLMTITLYVKSLLSKENNTMVIRKVIEVVTTLMEKLADLHDKHEIQLKPDTRQPFKSIQPSPLSAALALSIMRPTFERMADARLAKSIPSIYLLIGEILSPLFVMYAVSDCIKKNQNVKAQSEGIQLLNALITDFSPLLLPTNVVLEVFKDLLCEGRAQSKKSIHQLAGTILATRHIPNGKSLVSLLQSINPKKTVKQVLLKELEPLTYTPSAFPHLEQQVNGTYPRFLRGVRDTINTGPVDKQQLMAAVPDVSIQSKLNAEFMKEVREKIKDNNWKKRRDILHNLIQIFTLSSQFDTSPVIVELAHLFRSRLQVESNRVVAKCVVEAIGAFATCLQNGEPARQAGRIMLPALLQKYADRTTQLQVCVPALEALCEWMKLLGVIVFVNAAIFPAGGKPSTKISADKKEEFYGMVSDNIPDPETYFSQDLAFLNPDNLPLLPFVRLLCGEPLENRGVINVLILKLIPGLTQNDIVSLVSDIHSLPPAVVNQMQDILEAAQYRLEIASPQEAYMSQVAASDESRRLEDTVSSTSTVKPLNRIVSPTREKAVIKSNLSPQSALAVLPNPDDTCLPDREANFVAAGARWPLNLGMEDIERLAEEWRPHISAGLMDAMFPEVTPSKIPKVNRLVVALNFWSDILEFDTVSIPPGSDVRPPPDSLETRLSAHPTYSRIFGLHEGIMDLLFKWLTLRLADTQPRIHKNAAEVLYRAVSRLTTALGDSAYLMNAIQVMAEEENRQLSPEETQALLLLDQEGHITLTQTNLLLPHLLDKFSRFGNQMTATLVKDVTLNLALVTPDPAALFHMTLRIYQKRPEVLDLTNFLVEQHGWRLCRDINQELQDFARLSMSTEGSQDARFLAAHCMCLILLSLPRALAAEALKDLDHEVPGAKRYVARFVKANPQLITAFPPEGLPPLEAQDPSYQTVVSESHPTQEGTDTTTQQTPDDAAVEAVPFRDFMSEFEGIFADAEIEQMLEDSKSNILDMRFNMRIANCRLIMQDFMIELRKEKEGRNISVEYEMRYWNAMRRIEFVQQAPSVNHTTILLEISRLATGDPALIKEAAVRLKNLLSERSSLPGGASLEKQSTAASNSSAVFIKKSKSDTQTSPAEWPVVFSSELVSACAKALFTIFRHESLSQLTADNTAHFDDVAEAVTQLTLQMTKIRKVLYPVAPSQLKQLYRGVLTAMSCHTLWAVSPISNVIVERLNNIMGVHLMGIVSPRTASSLVEVTFEFLVSTSTDESNHVSQPMSLIDLDLFLRVFKRLLRKLNAKHPIGGDAAHPESAPSGVWPVYSHDRLNYLRLLDVALVCLLFVEIKIPFPSFASPALQKATAILNGRIDDTETEQPNPPTGDIDEDFLLSLRETLEICLRELFQVLFIYCPHLCAIYFRDKGFKSPHSLEEKIAAAIEKNLLTTEYDFPESAVESLKDATYLPLILVPNLTRNEYVSYCLEKLMRRTLPSNNGADDTPGTITKDGPPPTNMEQSGKVAADYFELHQSYVTSKATKLTVPDQLPPFSIDSFISAAPPAVTLKALDSTCASGWVKRRDALYLGEIPIGKQDVVPAADLLKSWASKLNRIKQAVVTNIPDVDRAHEAFQKEADDEHASSGDKLTRLAMRLRDIKDSLTPQPTVS
eukprot:Blabericola_migrator_1__10432@NODE_58_length_15904_cov_68_205342_g53_i0_p1_GENE_NODE_58_length_15904_cov_68_205342_g53_i0NODE_58_length_15904_cov_68_205342_g53_i0_p1_ORF_typecomplete_len2977_score518_99CLASP_N/PF12348_8/6_7e02CLASP_N/PF12348_8/1_1e11CLASP_N/PF12348_8/26CLASP_N/PF12348_8/1_1e04CLASP_N/PF12348_8/0_012CLASP_N/PF12348_8/8_2e03Cnd1/PF12717_7/0_19Cnd1/PF12717_7/1_8e04Cnd1/PF12717_7/41Cnd1/PF12717_7/2_2e02VATPase_H_C/PF11698_8/0_13VATPase_H_C/PF11698_8/9_2e02UBA_4/PF14555_6/0_8UBA_4/PF